MPSFYKGDNMKKVISLFLMIVMLMPLCLSAVAAEPEIVNTYEISDRKPHFQSDTDDMDEQPNWNCH